MNAWKALYIKELKNNRGIFLFLIAVTVGVNLYGYIRGIEDGRPTPYLALMVLPYATVLVLPFVLNYVFSEEYKAQTHYLLYSLPVSRATLMLCKFLAVLSVGVVVFVLATGVVHLQCLRLFALLGGSNAPEIDGADLWVMIGNFYFAILLPLLGIACAMVGLKLIVKKFQGLAMLAFLIGSLYLCGRVLHEAFRPLHRLFGSEIEMINRFGDVEYVPLFSGVPVFSLMVTVFFLALAVGLFERFSEA